MEIVIGLEEAKNCVEYYLRMVHGIKHIESIRVESVEDDTWLTDSWQYSVVLDKNGVEI